MYFNNKKDYLKYIGEERVRQMKSPKLSSLFFELTDGCNLKCLHCGSNCGPTKARYLSIELIKKTLQSVKNNIGTHSTLIILTGGEPLLHPHFFEIVHLISSIGVFFLAAICTHHFLFLP